jgi:hypothetical protein
VGATCHHQQFILHVFFFNAQVCSTLAGRPTTLKRSGSDYSATIFAKILDASNVAGLKPDRAGNEALENGPKALSQVWELL